MAKLWLILGAGGHGRSVCDAITASGDHVVGFLDDALPAGTLVSGTPVLGVLSLAWDLNRLFEASVEAAPDQVVVAIGNPALRQTWQQAGLIQSVSQAFLQWLRAWGEVGGIAPSQCSKAFLPQPISI
jgi:hypothetical protein